MTRANEIKIAIKSQYGYEMVRRRNDRSDMQVGVKR